MNCLLLAAHEMSAFNRDGIIRTWQFHRRNKEPLAILAKEINPIVRSWINYYGEYRRSDLYSICETLDRTLVRWVRIAAFLYIRSHIYNLIY